MEYRTRSVVVGAHVGGAPCGRPPDKHERSDK
jgi:hypothetical protein